VLELSKKVHDAREKLASKQQELQSQENELENIRGQMDYYKTQLRGLYYKCLKDDAALLYFIKFFQHLIHS
jgi:peptidoglycan hydrolase CwlO-like protein